MSTLPSEVRRAFPHMASYDGEMRKGRKPAANPKDPLTRRGVERMHEFLVLWPVFTIGYLDTCAVDDSTGTAHVTPQTRFVHEGSSLGTGLSVFTDRDLANTFIETRSLSQAFVCELSAPEMLIGIIGMLGRETRCIVLDSMTAVPLADALAVLRRR